MNHAARVMDLLQRKIGLDPETIGQRSYEVAIDRRCAATEALPEEYVARLGRDPEEIEQLIEEIVVPETWFFRDQGPFQELSRFASTAWRNRASIAVLSVPCSTGEEPYSIAISLLDAGFAPNRIRIEALDVSQRALEKAKLGKYGKHSFRGQTPNCNHLHSVGDHFEISDVVRRCVSFRRENCIDRSFLTGSGRYDAIFCRNLLIYLDAESRRRALTKLLGALAEEGCLFVGHAESGLLSREVFRPLGHAGSFAFVRATVSSEGPAPPKVSPVTRSRTSTSRDRVPFQAPKKPNEERAKSAELQKDLLRDAAEQADRGNHEKAEALCLASLVDTGPSAEAYYLLGVIRRAVGDPVLAESFFHRALYLREGHYEALVQLALIREQKGDVSGAANFRRRADRAVKAVETQ